MVLIKANLAMKKVQKESCDRKRYFIIQIFTSCSIYEMQYLRVAVFTSCSIDELQYLRDAVFTSCSIDESAVLTSLQN